MSNPHNFKPGDKVMGSNVNGYLANCPCIIKGIHDFQVYFDYCKDGRWFRNCNVGTLSVFRPLTKLEKTLL